MNEGMSLVKKNNPKLVMLSLDDEEDSDPPNFNTENMEACEEIDQEARLRTSMHKDSSKPDFDTFNNSTS